MAQYFAGGSKPVFDITRKFGKKNNTKGKTNTIKKGSDDNFKTVDSFNSQSEDFKKTGSNNLIIETVDSANPVTTDETKGFFNVKTSISEGDVVLEEELATGVNITSVENLNDPVVDLALKSVGPRSRKDDIVEYAKSLGIELNADVLTKKEMLAIINENEGTGNE